MLATPPTCHPRARGLRGAGRSTGALQRVEQRVGGLALGLHRLGLAEARQGVGAAARLVLGVGQRRTKGHAQKRIAAAVGEVHGLLGVAHRGGHVAQRQLQLAQVVGVFGGLRPARLFDGHLQPGPHRLDGLPQPAQGAEAEGGLAQQPGLVASASAGETRLQGGSKKQATAPRSAPKAPTWFVL